MKSRSLLARALDRRRNELAEELRAAAPGPAGALPVLLVRPLFARLADALDQSNPEPVLQWAAMVRTQHPDADVHTPIALACDRVARIGESLHADYSALVVFLEIVKSAASDVVALQPRPAGAPRTETSSAVIEGVLAMLKARDEATCAHSQATGAWCRRLAQTLGLPSSTTELIVQAGVLHDIGKIATPDAILFKSGPLTEDEWNVMRRHAAYGADILCEIPSLAHCATIVRAHHERFDGNGYPDRIAGDEIPFEARVIAVADAFHAMISLRPYRQPIGQREALGILRAGSGTQWDPRVVSAMISMLERPHEVPQRSSASAR